jgi:hypothetical protein
VPSQIIVPAHGVASAVLQVAPKLACANAAGAPSAPTITHAKKTEARMTPRLAHSRRVRATWPRGATFCVDERGLRAAFVERPSQRGTLDARTTGVAAARCTTTT